MSSLFPDEFPFSRKRKSRRPKVAEPTAFTSAEKAPSSEATLSATPVAAATPTSDIAAIAAAAPARVTPPVAAAAAETTVHVQAAAAETAIVRVTHAMPPVSPPASIHCQAATNAVTALSTTPVRVAGQATSPATFTPAATSLENTRATAPTAGTGDAASDFSGSERRRSPRQSLRAKAIYRSDANPAGAGPVQVLDLSTGGVRLWSTRPMKKGDRGNVRLEAGPLKWSGRVKVVACDAHDDEGFSVGCEFATYEMSRRVA